MAELNTYGDLKKVIKAISLKQKGEKIGNVALNFKTRCQENKYLVR